MYSDYVHLKECTFEEELQDTFLSYLKNMTTKDLDYWDIQNILNLIKKRQWEEIIPYMEKINETYAAVKVGVKLGRDKHYKRMGAIGARGHYRANPRPWAA